MFSCDSCELNGLAEYDVILNDGETAELCGECLDMLNREGVVIAFVRFTGLAELQGVN